MPHAETLLALVADALSGPDRDTLAQRDVNGTWVMTSSQALRERIRSTAAGLRAAGIAPGERVAIMAPNSVNWIVANLAILHAGAIAVPLYATQAHDQVRHILDHSEARLLFIDTPQMRDALEAGGIVLPPTIALASGDGEFSAFEAAGWDAAQREPDALEAIGRQITPDDLAVLIYTSGTTGTPKGVMLTHRNIASNAIDTFGTLGGVVQAGEAVLSILPYAHIYESTNLYGYLRCRYVVYVNTKLDALLDDLRAVQPVMLLAVPRVFERILTGVVVQAKGRGGVLAAIVLWALAVGREYMRARTAGRRIGLGRRLQYALARRAVLRKIKPRLGLTNLRCCASGSAALHPDTALTYLGFGVTICEGYGLTECSPVVTVNAPLDPAIGTVGSVIPNVEITLAEDGELLVRGPGVMKGYYRDLAATERAIANGWLQTGDIATIRADGCVRIVDRKNELFKTSGGKYIAPARIESALLRSIYFNQVMVLGAGRSHPVALVSANLNAVREELHLPGDIPADITQRSDVRRFLEHEARLQTADLAPFERIRTIGILPRDLTIADGELSPTLKIRRRTVEARYGALVADRAAVLAPRLDPALGRTHGRANRSVT